MTLADKILCELKVQSGLTDRALAETILGTRHRIQQINGECRHLEMLGRIERRTSGEESLLRRLQARRCAKPVDGSGRMQR